MYLNTAMDTIPEAGRSSKTEYANVVKSFAASGVDISGVTLSENEKPNTVKRGIAGAIKAAKIDAVCIVRAGSVFIVTGPKARELGYIATEPAKPRKKRGEKQAAPMVDGL